MRRPIVHLLTVVLLAAGPAPLAFASSAVARVAAISTPVAELAGVQARLDWANDATRGDLRLRVARVDAPALGLHYRDLDWRCALGRDGDGGWRCDGPLRVAGGGAPLRLSVALGTATTTASLARGPAALRLTRSAATPDDTRLLLERVPLAWTQALLAQAAPTLRAGDGRLDGEVRITAPTGAPLRLRAGLALDGGAFDSADGSIAAQGLALRADVDARVFPGAGPTLVAASGRIDRGELLFGSAYAALGGSPVAWHLDAHGEGGRWTLPAFAWDDGHALRVEGEAALDAEAALRSLALRLRSEDLSTLPARYLSGWLGVAGLGGLAMTGALEADVAMVDGSLARADASLRAIDIAAPDGRFRIDGLDGDLRFSSGAEVASTLRWRGGTVGAVPFGAAVLPWRSAGGVLASPGEIAVPLLGGALRLHDLSVRPPAGGEGLRIEAGLGLDDVDLGALATALGAPAFRGTIDGEIPRARYAGERLELDGGLSMQVFDGVVQVTSLAMERPFGVAPTLVADLDVRGVDLLAITGVFDFGSMTGRLDGHVHGLRLVDWSPVAFDAAFRTVPARGVPQRISQRAVQDIGSVGDASFVGSIQGRLIGLFDDFGYRRIGLSCRLANEVCTMGGLDSGAGGFTIVEGAGVPRLDVVGHNTAVDWPVLVERLMAVGSGDVSPVIE